MANPGGEVHADGLSCCLLDLHVGVEGLALLLLVCRNSGHHTLKVLPELKVALTIAEAALDIEALRHLAIQRVERAEEVGLGIRQHAMFGCSAGRDFE